MTIYQSRLFAGHSRQPTSDSQNKLRQIWREQRNNGTGSVIAAYADAALLGHIDWHRPGHPNDPVAFAHAAFLQGCRNGTLSAA